jgi:transcriptional regulator with XRE-family HTH domain
MGINEEKYKKSRKLLLDYLRQTAREKGITHLSIAEKTGFTANNVSRMLQGRYSPTLDNFIRLAESVNCYFFIIDKEADDDLVEIMKNRWGAVKEN